MSLHKKGLSIYSLTLSILIFIFNLEHIYIIAGNKAFMQILNIIEWPFYFILILLVLKKRIYKYKELFVLTLIGFLLLCVYISSGYAALIKMFVVVVASKGIRFNKVISISLRTYVVSFIFTLALYITGISNSGIQRRGYSALGYTSANVAGGIVFVILLLWLYSRKQIKKNECFIVWLVSLLIFFIINNRAVVILLILAPILNFVIAYCLRNRKLKSTLKKSFYVLPILLIGLCVVTAYIYPYNFYIQELDIVLNNRIFLNYRNLVQYGVNIFGQATSWQLNENFYNSVTGLYSTYNTVDNAYICLLIQMGVVSTVIYIVAFIKNVKMAFDNNDSVLIMMILLLAMYGITESSTIEVFINIPFIYLLSSKTTYADNNREDR